MDTHIPTFASLGLKPDLLKALADAGYETPSPIQASCIPLLLEQHDLLGQAQTGTGKTAAFALPVLQHLELNNPRPQVLVLTPTRELALQVAESFQTYSCHMKGFHVLPLYGGQSMTVQLRNLKRGAHVIVGTPGRVMDHLERKSLDLSGLRTLVLDEADEMLRMGFIDDVEWILEHTPQTRQTALFSATMPTAVRRVAQRHLKDTHEEIKVQSTTTTVERIEQCFCQVTGPHKLDALTRILEVESTLDAAIIFVRTKTETVELASKLEARGYAAAALNGDMTQQLRERALEQIKNGTLDIIVATDVAARGLDVPRVTHVINYDIPYDTEAYVHRIGRTGRAGRAGKAILFVTPREKRMLGMIEKATKQKIAPITMPSWQTITDHRIARFRQGVAEVLATEDLVFFYELISNIEAGSAHSPEDIAAALAFLVQKERPLKPSREEMRVAESGRGESRRACPDEPAGERRGRKEKTYEASPRQNFRGNSDLVRYRIEVGYQQQVTPRDIVGALANEAGIPPQDIGQINLYDEYSTIELPTGISGRQLTVLGKIRVRQFPLAISIDEGAPAEKPRGRPAAFGKKTSLRNDERKPVGRKPAAARPPRAVGAKKRREK